MKRRKSILGVSVFLLLILGFVLALGGCATETAVDKDKEPAGDSGDGQEAEVIELSFASFMPPEGAFEADVTAAFVEEVEKATNGRVKVIVYAGGSLLDGPSIYDGVVDGVADMGFLSLPWLAGRFPIADMFVRPGGMNFPNGRVASYVINEALKELDPQEFHDAEPLMFFCSGPGVIFSNVPVRTLADMKGLQVRAGEAVGEGLKKLGAVPVTMPSSEQYEALQKGVVDANISPLEMLKSHNLVEVSDYVIHTPFLYNTTFGWFINKDTYASLPEDIQKALHEASDIVFEQQASVFFDNTNEEGLQWALEQKKDLEQIFLTEEETALWKEKINPVFEDYVEELNGKGLPGTAAKNLILELTEKYSAIYQ